MIDGKKIVQQYEKYIARDANFRAGWNTLAPYIQPTRTRILVDGLKVPGIDQTMDLYDSTSVTVAETAASFVWGNVMNPATKWMTMVPRDSELAEVDEVREWADEVVKVMLASYTQSNFYYESFEALIDYIGFGTCDLHVEEKSRNQTRQPELGFRGLVFKAYPIGTFTIDENSDGEIDVRYARYFMSARSIVNEFGEDAVSGNLRDAAKNEQQRLFEIIHCIEPRGYDQQKSKAAKHMPFGSYWIERDTKQVLRESGYEEFPDAIARYQKTGGEVFGRSPGFTALPDIRTLNKLKEDSLESLEMAIKPPILSALEEGSLGTFQLFPGGMNTVKLRPGMNDVRQALAPFENGQRWDVTNLKEQELRDSIERVFHVKQIRDLLEAEKMQTAYEYAQKLALLNKMLGPVWGRMQREFLNRLNERCFALLFRRGAFPPPPDVLTQKGADLDWRYEGPLAKAQRVDEANATMQWIQAATVISQFQPDVVHRVDGDESVKILSEIYGVPAKAVRSDKQVQAIMQGVQQARQAENTKQDILAATQGAKNLAPLAQRVLPMGPDGMPGGGQGQAA